MRVQVQDRQWSKAADKNQIDICVEYDLSTMTVIEIEEE
mgnify:CR=1 FL=1